MSNNLSFSSFSYVHWPDLGIISLCKQMSVCHTAAASLTFQMNSLHITSAVTEGGEPKFIQGQGLKVNLLFSVLSKGGSSHGRLR